MKFELRIDPFGLLNLLTIPSWDIIFYDTNHKQTIFHAGSEEMSSLGIKCQSSAFYNWLLQVFLLWFFKGIALSGSASRCSWMLDVIG